MEKPTEDSRSGSICNRDLWRTLREYVTGDLLSVRLYQFFGTLCVVCVRGLSICLTITEYRIVTEYKLAHFPTTAMPFPLLTQA